MAVEHRRVEPALFSSLLGTAASHALAALAKASVSPSRSPTPLATTTLAALAPSATARTTAVPSAVAAASRLA